MTLDEFWERITVFLKNLPETISETFVWLVVSYLIPLLNIGIIYGIRKNSFKIDLPILAIVIATNACFYTSLYYLAFNNSRKRKLIKLVNLAAFTTTVALFAISTIELEINKPLFSIWLYKTLTAISFLIALILALISKYDEVKALSRERAREARNTTDTQIGGKNIKV